MSHPLLCSLQNAHFCTKFCVNGAASRNFFQGCRCKSNCQTKACPCFAAKRECDPDLCTTCGACTDPEGVLAGDSCSKQNCRNDGISMRRHKHLLVGVSGIKDAGWGLYTKNALSKDDFIQEYTGELISQEEADRRGRVYDKVCFPSDDDAAKNNKIVKLTLLTLLPPLSFPFFFK